MIEPYFAWLQRSLRRQKASIVTCVRKQIIRSSTRKAVVGALAAVSPGTDVIIQGYIGTAMTRELCNLFGAAPRDIDIEDFLNLSQSRAGKALPLSLAVAGNGLKAFPGHGNSRRRTRACGSLRTYIRRARSKPRHDAQKHMANLIREQPLRNLRKESVNILKRVFDRLPRWPWSSQKPKTEIGNRWRIRPPGSRA